METYARAGVDVYGRSLRYVEVERYGDRYRLLRLGRCVFDFEVIATIYEGTHREHLDTLSEALEDVFEGSVASRLHVTLHPPDCYSFFSPQTVGLSAEESQERLHRDAALLMQAQNAPPWHLTPDLVWADDETVWFHALVLEEPFQKQLDQVLRPLPFEHHRLMVSMQAAAEAITQLGRRSKSAASAQQPSYELAVGWYPTHLEYTLCRRGHWHFSQFADASDPADSTYFAAALLNRLGLPLSNIAQVYVYGEAEDLSAFEGLELVLQTTPQRLDPFTLIDLDAAHAADFDAHTYALCIGSTF